MAFPVRAYSGHCLAVGISGNSPIDLMLCLLNNINSIVLELQKRGVLVQRENNTYWVSILDTLAIITEAFTNARSDSMDRGCIVYFPNIHLTKEILTMPLQPVNKIQKKHFGM